MSIVHSQRVIVGMSGGVDSSVAAMLLLERGYSVEGLFMKNWEEDDHSGACGAARDLADATDVCARLGIKLHHVNFAYEYWEHVFGFCLDEFRAGRTPNPDVLCNKEIKFKAFLEHALNLNADYIATGHYAGIESIGDTRTMLKGRDESKDQTYFLYMLGQAQLSRVLFPLAGMTKIQVRALAKRAGLKTFDKQDSTGLCFIGERPFRAFLARFLSARPGDIVDPDGMHLGRHQGLSFYTIGQRRGLGIGGRRGVTNGAWYVVNKDLPNNRVTVAHGHDHPLLFSSELIANQAQWMNDYSPELPLRCTAKIRYRQRDQCCTVFSDQCGALRVRFDQPQRAITPGQSVVFYAGAQCLGGGIIERSAAMGQ